MTDEILKKHIAKYLDTSDTADKVGEKLLSTNDFMEPIATFIQRRTSKAITKERIVIKMEEHLKLQTVDEDAKHVKPK